jgi:predicted RND superfamily exporter protein
MQLLNRFAALLLRNRIAFIIGLLALTVLMGYYATRVQLSYSFARVLPEHDSTQVQYEEFKKLFGEDGNVMVIGFKDPNFYTQKKVADFYQLCEKIKQMHGISGVISPTHVFNLQLDSTGILKPHPLLDRAPANQEEADAFKNSLLELPFYEGLVYSDDGAILAAINFNKKDLNSKNRITIVDDIVKMTDAFAVDNSIDMHYSGMPYIRTVSMKKVSGEMSLFLLLAVIITGILLLIIFRSASAIIISMSAVIIGVVWSLGLLGIAGFSITILSGLIPPIILVIGIPNCVFLINKYHAEYTLHNNKVKALSRMISGVGGTLFLANVTTAIGFGVLYFTDSSLLVEFGVIAAISVMTTYIITLIFIPIALFYLPVPREKHTSYLQSSYLTGVLRKIDKLVHHKRKVIYVAISIVTVIGFVGMYFININGYVVDDLPEDNPVYKHIRFFESSFKGVLPLEIMVNTGEENGVLNNNAKVLYKINSLQKLIAKYPEFSRPISIAEAVKFANQAYKGGDKKFYIVPGLAGLKDLSAALPAGNQYNNGVKSFIDSSKSIARISYQVADIGSIRMESLLNELKPKADSIFGKSASIRFTGHSPVFLKNNGYLLSNLLESLVIEIVLITLLGLALFRSLRIILLSKLPVLIPLIVTAGVMGFADIRFKPSTILIFSIAFGITSDGTIYFLNKYRQELRKKGATASKAISGVISETGISMIYTNIILFFGFGIFAASDFGGTVALGILISLTLLLSLCTNLVLLPALLLSIDRYISRKELIADPLIEIEEEIEEPPAT